MDGIIIIVNDYLIGHFSALTLRRKQLSKDFFSAFFCFFFLFWKAKDLDLKFIICRSFAIRFLVIVK